MNKSSFLQLGLIGWPVEHSLSPVIHKAALKACGLDGDYRLIPIPPLPNGEEKLLDLLQTVRKGELTGFNVTIPHKLDVIPYLDRLTLTAKRIGAVNTVFMDNGCLTGDNTDGEGFLNDINAKIPRETQSKIALVLGAGGSCRAVAFNLGVDGWQVKVAARRKEQAQELIESIQAEISLDLEAYRLESEVLREITPQLLVNTTPVGMSPNFFETPWPLGDNFPKDCFVYDLIYNPETTMLIRQARQSGLSASNGLGMLVEQAGLAFQRWTGAKPPLQTMHEAVQNSIQNEYHREIEK